MALKPGASSDEQAAPSDSQDTTSSADKTSRVGQKKREIKGGLPYATAPGTLKKALDGIIVAERPDKFSGDFMATMLRILGGSQRPIPQMFRKMGFITADGTPTDLYSRFKSDTARGQAALDGLRSAYAEIFKRNQYAHRATDAEIKDIIIEITGLQKTDQIVRMISQTFETIRAYVDKSATPTQSINMINSAQEDVSENAPAINNQRSGVGLSYHINIVLPPTENIAVFNAIFKSVRENLL